MQAIMLNSNSQQIMKDYFLGRNQTYLPIFYNEIKITVYRSAKNSARCQRSRAIPNLITEHTV